MGSNMLGDPPYLGPCYSPALFLNTLPSEFHTSETLKIIQFLKSPVFTVKFQAWGHVLPCLGITPLATLTHHPRISPNLASLPHAFWSRCLTIFTSSTSLLHVTISFMKSGAVLQLSNKIPKP